MIIDRIENGIAVIEDKGRFIEVNVSELPDDSREGSVLIKCAEGYILDPVCEEERRKAAAELKMRLFRRRKNKNND